MSLRPLATAEVWSRQRRVYENLGQRAWSEGLVPWRVTTCPLAAELQAGLVAAFARDARRAGWLGPGEALAVWDVGGGTGRLAFHLGPALEREGVPSSLVLTDVARSNVDAWFTQPQLAPGLEGGALRAAWYDVLGDAGPVDARTGEALSPRGPLVVLANYLFDSLPHGAWRTRAGRVFEGWCDDAAEAWAWREAAPPEAFAAVLAGGPDSTRLLPVGALEALRRWRAWTEGRLLVLAIDKGATLWGPDEAPRLARHGSVSAGVDFDALGAAWSGGGGRARVLAPTEPSSVVALYAFVSGPSPELEGEYLRVAASNPLLRVYGRLLPAALAGTEGAPAVGVARNEEGEEGRAGARENGEQRDGDGDPARDEGTEKDLAGDRGSSDGVCQGGRRLVVESAMDPDVLAQLGPSLRSRVPGMTAGERAEWLALVAACADRHFVFRQTLDVPFELGALAHALGGLALAEQLYAFALAESGPRARTLYFLACAAKDLGHDAEAAAAVARLLEVDPEHEGGLALRERFALAP